MQYESAWLKRTCISIASCIFQCCLQIFFYIIIDPPVCCKSHYHEFPVICLWPDFLYIPPIFSFFGNIHAILSLHIISFFHSFTSNKILLILCPLRNLSSKVLCHQLLCLFRRIIAEEPGQLDESCLRKHVLAEYAADV